MSHNPAPHPKIMVLSREGELLEAKPVTSTPSTQDLVWFLREATDYRRQYCRKHNLQERDIEVRICDLTTDTN